MIQALLIGLASAAPVDEVRQLLALGERSSAEGQARAADHIEARIQAVGLTPQRFRAAGYDTPFGCVQGQLSGSRLVLAHLDTVHPDVPGAVDNAAAVAVALEAAAEVADESIPACFAFPFEEERGMLGSRAMAAALGSDGPALVIALDLVGQGELTVTGLGTGWGDEGLRWLHASAPEVSVPWAYRAVSRVLPGNERSDHAPFARRGVPALHLLGRGPAGVYWAYHTPQDTLEQLEIAAMRDAIAAVVGMVRAEPLRPGSEPALSTPMGVIPGLLVRLGGLVGGLAGVVLGLRGGLFGGLRSLAVVALMTAVGCLVWGLGAWGRPSGGALAGPLTACLGAGAALGLSLLPQRERSNGGAMSAGLLALAAAWFEPVLALPLGLGALGIGLAERGGAWRVGALAALPVPVYLALADSHRELLFHGLLPDGPAWKAPILLLTWWPLGAVLLSLPRPRWLRWVALVGVVAALAWAGSTEPWAEPFWERAALNPLSDR